MCISIFLIISSMYAQGSKILSFMKAKGINTVLNDR